MKDNIKYDSNNIDLYNLLDESWNKVLNEWYSKGMIQEGLSDFLKGNKKKQKTPSSDELEKQKRTGQGNPRSKFAAAGITVLNGVGKLLSGGNGKWENVRGGLFDSDRQSGELHKRSETQLSDRGKALVSYVINCTLLAYLIKTYCAPTKFTLVQVDENNRVVQLCREKSAVDNSNFNHASSGIKDEDHTFDLQQELMVIKNWLLKEGGIKPDFNNQDYMWLYKEIINEVKLFANVGNAKNGFAALSEELGAIDKSINRYCYESHISRLVDAQRDETIQVSMQKKYQIVSERFDKIVEEMKYGAETYQIQITNGFKYFDIASQIFDYKVILTQLSNLKQLTLQEFMQKQNWNQGRQPQPKPKQQMPSQQQ